jgi:uncharacterized cupredoxin-like copper-binding protein
VRRSLDRRTALVCAVLAPLAVVAPLEVAGCGGKESASPGARVIHVTERDFKISAPEVVSAGDHVFQVDNKGPDDHELIVVRRKDGAELPFRTDGITLDEDAVAHQEAGALEPQAPGTHELHVHMKPGHYILFCNMSGHYLGGMDRDLVVR